MRTKCHPMIARAQAGRVAKAANSKVTVSLEKCYLTRASEETL